MSHILSLIMEDRHFLAVQATEYQDWGTQEDWYQYMRERPVLFVDIDGTLIANHISPIDNNIKVINKMVERGAHLIITTSRPEQDRERTIAQLEKFGIRYSQLIMGLPHTSRVIINDFFPTNPYPSAVAINIPRDCDDLGAYLGMSVK